MFLEKNLIAIIICCKIIHIQRRGNKKTPINVSHQSISSEFDEW